MSDARSEALDWLSTFEAACRGQDFAAGRRLFAPDAVAFGTYATAVHGLDNIEREQWRQIWPRIRGFRFESQPAVAGAGDSAWIAATWASEATGPDGQPFTRRGRASSARRLPRTAPSRPDMEGTGCAHTEAAHGFSGSPSPSSSWPRWPRRSR